MTQMLQSSLRRAATLGGLGQAQQNEPQDLPRSKYEIFKEKAEAEVDRMTQDAFYEKFMNDSGADLALEDSPHKTYMENRPGLLKMHSMMCAMGKVPSVSMLALFSSGFKGVEAACSWAYERDDDSNQYQHSFVESLPKIDLFTTIEAYLVNEDNDLEKGSNIEAYKMCYICGVDKTAHGLVDQNAAHAGADPQDMVFLRQISIRRASTIGKREAIGEMREITKEVVFDGKYGTRSELVAEFKQQVEETRCKIVDGLAEQEKPLDGQEEAPYCEICYCNEIVAQEKEIPAGELSTVEFECSHRFCSECTVEQLKQHIERAEIQKLVCFNFECKKPISDEKIREILTAHDRNDLAEKFGKFKGQKELDSDPLVRWCPSPNCGQHMRATSRDETKMTCTKCQTEFCFQCRDLWHGTETTCEQAMKSQLAGWAEENKDNVSFCPMCRTRIEKNKGCNHMTCGFCKYEFCWVCGASSTTADNHFGFGRGCGIGMMDENAKPGQLAEHGNKCMRVCKLVAIVILCVILYPFFLVLYCPIVGAISCGKMMGSSGCGCLGWLIGGIIGFVIGLMCNIVFIPFVLIITLCFLLVMFCKCMKCILCDRCSCTNEQATQEAEQRNRRAAEEVIEQRKKEALEGGSKV